MTKFNFENNLKNNASKNIFCGDKECDGFNNLIEKYNDKFELSRKKYEEVFESSFKNIKENMKNKFDEGINKKMKNLEKKQEKIVGLLKQKFDLLIENKVKQLSDENINNIFNNLEENPIKEIKNQLNTNIINIKNNFSTKMKENFDNYLLSAKKEIKKKNFGIIQDFSWNNKK